VEGGRVSDMRKGSDEEEEEQKKKKREFIDIHSYLCADANHLLYWLNTVPH
jgi:hypothetical protein